MQFATDPLTAWRCWYSLRGLRNTRVAVVGDSISFGSGASHALNGFCVRLSQFLNNVPAYGTNPTADPDIPTVGGGYHVRCAINTSAPDPWATIGAPTLIDRGTGGQSRGLPTGSRISFTAKTATAFYLTYEDGAGATPPKATVTNSTGAAVAVLTPTVDPGAPAYTRRLAATPRLPRGKYTIALETMTVCGGSGAAVVDGVYVEDGDANTGIVVTNHCFPGLDTATLTSGTVRAATFFDSLPVPFKPDALVVNLGANDYGFNLDPAAFQTNLATVIDLLRAKTSTPTAPVVLVGWFQRWDITAPAYPWAQYAAAIRTIAAQKPCVEYLDMTPLMPESQAEDTAGFKVVSPDLVHLSDRGHSYYAQRVTDVLLQPPPRRFFAT